MSATYEVLVLRVKSQWGLVSQGGETTALVTVDLIDGSGEINNLVDNEEGVPLDIAVREIRELGLQGWSLRSALTGDNAHITHYLERKK